jgi:hypothetical protein
MKNLILLVFLCFSNSFVKSQLLCEWGDYNEFAQSYFMDVAVDNAGFTYVSGYFGGQIQVGTNTVYAESYPDGYIMKYSQNGDRLWVTSFSSSDNVFTFEMDVDNAGNTTIYGKFRSNLSVDGVTITASSSSSENGFVAQLNPDGDLNWIKNITSSSANYWARYLEVDDSGNVLFENYNTSTIDGFTNYGHYTLTKLDPLGNVLWRYDKELFGGSNYKSNLIAEFNNGYVIAGHINDTTVIAGTTIYPTNDTIIDPYNDTTLLLKPETVLIFLKTLAPRQKKIVVHRFELYPIAIDLIFDHGLDLFYDNVELFLHHLAFHDGCPRSFCSSIAPSSFQLLNRLASFSTFDL